MTDRRPILITVVALAIFFPLLLASGLIVRSLVANSFHTAQQTRAARLLTFATLTYQLDEETGLRGYAATRDTEFLEPYRSGRADIEESLRNLRTALAALGLDDATASVEDAMAVNARWVRSVAKPTLNSRGKSALRIEQNGKYLVDRFRADIDLVDSVLTAREDADNARTRLAIDRIGTFLGVVIVVVMALALLFLAQQARLTARLEAKRRESEEERRRGDSLAAAYATEKRIADTLQGAFSQRRLPVLPKFRLSARYTPATEETKVGGDWYDALELPADRVFFAVGDVTGHGIQAAVTMNRVRHALVASSMLDSDPARLLARVNEELLSQDAPMVTAVAAYADARTNEFHYACAGHPAPILLEPGCAPRLLDCGSPPLGVVEWAQYRASRVRSVAGAMLVLYTDGAIEHTRNVITGESLLLRAIAKLNPDAPDPAGAIHDAIFSESAVGDDVAILTVAFAREEP